MRKYLLDPGERYLKGFVQYVISFFFRKPDTYILRVGDAGSHNLNLQHIMLNDVTVAQLKKAHISKGMIAWDIGCGSGVVTEIIAKEVGPSGRVYAADISSEQLVVTRERMGGMGLNNVEYVKESIENITPELYGKADVVHARLLLMHVQDADLAIKKMSAFLKPGGVVISQESSMDSLHNEYSGKSINRYYDLVAKYGAKKNLNFNVGSRLPALFQGSNLFENIETYKTRFPLDTENGKKLVFSRFSEIKEKLITEQLTDEQEMDDIKAEMERYPLADSIEDSKVYTEQTHIIAKRSTSCSLTLKG